MKCSSHPLSKDILFEAKESSTAHFNWSKWGGQPITGCPAPVKRYFYNPIAEHNSQGASKRRKQSKCKSQRTRKTAEMLHLLDLTRMLHHWNSSNVVAWTRPEQWQCNFVYCGRGGNLAAPRSAGSSELQRDKELVFLRNQPPYLLLISTWSVLKAGSAGCSSIFFYTQSTNQSIIKGEAMNLRKNTGGHRRGWETRAI